MQLIIDTLEAARLTASPAKAMDLADAIADLRALDRDFEDIVVAVSAFDALKLHIDANPFAAISDNLFSDDVVEWLAVLERIAS